MRAHLDLTSEPSSVGAGRRAVFELLTGWGVTPGLVSDAVLVVSELVTNAVVHAPSGAPLALDLSLRRPVLRIALADGSAVHPTPRHASRSDENGRGMGILDTLAARWGVQDLALGKCLWFEMDV